MPVLLNAKHERVAQFLAAGKSAHEAHTEAGYTSNRHNAATLARKQHILERVAEILSERERMHGQATAKAVERISLTKEWILARLVENAQRAMQAEAVLDDNGDAIGQYNYQGNVANRALELLGKELGMFIDRREIGEAGEFQALEDGKFYDALRQEAAELGVDLAGAADTRH